ncbi:RagB/SusD family nutrient uptake outer membrane protein, partial [termite gut metagenome]
MKYKYSLKFFSYALFGLLTACDY